jgi:hypothetical protein
MAEKLHFEFIGGPLDGLIIDEPLGSSNLTTADGLLRHSEGGKPGATVWMATPYTMEMLRTYSLDTIEQFSPCGYRFPGHTYQIIVRRISGPNLIVRARHIGATE